MTVARRRSTADERRAELLAAALSEFAVGRLRGTSTEASAKRAGAASIDSAAIAERSSW
jgi:hypothetical protein